MTATLHSVQPHPQDETILAKSRLWHARHGGAPSEDERGRASRLLEKFHRNDSILDPEVAQGIISSCPRGETPLSERRIEDYSIECLSTRGASLQGFEKDWGVMNTPRGEEFEVYLDAPFALGLFYRGEPNAVIGFDFPVSDLLFVSQIQGIRRNVFDESKTVVSKKGSRGLAALDWERALILLAAEFGYREGFTRIGIQSGKYNRWANRPSTSSLYLPPERATARYDLTAKRTGFNSGNDGNWYSSIIDLKKPLQ